MLAFNANISTLQLKLRVVYVQEDKLKMLMDVS